MNQAERLQHWTRKSEILIKAERTRRCLIGWNYQLNEGLRIFATATDILNRTTLSRLCPLVYISSWAKKGFGRSRHKKKASHNPESHQWKWISAKSRNGQQISEHVLASRLYMCITMAKKNEKRSVGSCFLIEVLLLLKKKRNENVKFK